MAGRPGGGGGGGGACRLWWLSETGSGAADFPQLTEPLRPGVTPSRPWAWPGATGGRRGGGGDRWRAAGPEPGQAMAASERLYELWLLYYAQVSPSRPWSARSPDPRRAVPAAPASGVPPPQPPVADRCSHAGLQPRTHVRAPGRRAASGICARSSVRGHALYCKSPSDTVASVALVRHFHNWVN